MIAYDGTKTEDDYFRSWSQILLPDRLTLIPQYVRSGGNVLRAVEEASKRLRKMRDFAEFWCVCDVDDTPQSDLVNAKALAAKNGIRLCLSKRSFEIWIMLHFELITGPVQSEKEAISGVQKHLNYFGAPRKIAQFYDLFPRTQYAVQNGEQLEIFAFDNPSTKVHNLVRKLLQNYQ